MKFSQFFEDLKKYSTSLEIKDIPPTGDKIYLERFGQRIYDTVVVFAHKTNAFGNQYEDFKAFLDNGGSAFIFNSEHGSEFQSQVLRHLGVKHLESSSIQDVLGNKDVVLRKFVAPESLVSSAPNPIVFQGSYAVIDRPNDYRMPIVVGGLEHYDKSGKGRIIANDLVPIHCLQSRNGGRVCVIHSHSFATDEYFDKKVLFNEELIELETPISNGNRALLLELIEWVTSYKSYAKIVSSTHYDPLTLEAPVQYHIKQNITIKAELITHIAGSVEPYTCEDVQVEIFMLGTFIRRHMKKISPGVFEESLILPDRAGNYKIKVFTSKFGWMNAREEMPIAVRPLGIREKERFLPMAQPYHYSMMVIMIGAFFVAVHFLYHEPKN